MNRDPKHVAIFDHIFYMGGVERVFVAYAEILLERGYRVDLVISRTSAEMLSLVPDDVTLISLGEGTFRQMPARLRKYLKGSTAATLITGNELDNFAAILTNLSFCKKEHIKLIISQHSVPNDDDRDAGFIGRLFPLGKRLLYRFADSIIAVSEAVSLSLKHSGVPSDKIHLINNPLDLHRIEQLSEQEPSIDLPKRYIVAVGRLHRVKNIGLLIEAFDLIESPDMELLIVGDGPLRAQWERMAQQSERREKIHFTGTVTNSAAIISHASVVAVPSTSEAFPMTVVESLALGKTIAHTPNGGCCEILGSRYGYSSKGFVDAQDFANTLNQAIQNPLPPKQLIARAGEFDYESFSKKLFALLG